MMNSEDMAAGAARAEEEDADTGKNSEPVAPDRRDTAAHAG